MFRWREQVSTTDGSPSGSARFGVEWAITDRFDGVSTGSHSTFNLGAGVRDRPGAVARNREILAAEFGVESSSLRFMRQVHGCHVEVLDADHPAGQDEDACDAMITNRPDIALAVLVADCTPVLLLDRQAGWVGAVHAGRAGMTDGVVVRTVHELRERGASNLEAVVGPSICGRCYEVPGSMRDHATNAYRAAYAVSWSGTAAIDVSAAVVEQLASERVDVRWLPGCTRESRDLYSHRGDPHSGRFAAVVRLAAPATGS
ncbi:MAG: peptidoglycan editing factor PgeF [Ornithinimicrobium sp.]